MGMDSQYKKEQVQDCTNLMLGESSGRKSSTRAMGYFPESHPKISKHLQTMDGGNRRPS